MTDALETRSITQLSRYVAVPPGAIVPLQVEGAPAGGVPVEALFGKYLSVVVSYETAAELLADLAHPDRSLALVYGDPDPGNSVYWYKDGAEGAGAWIKTNIARGQEGPTGPSNSTFLVTSELEAADVTNASAILAEVGKAGTFTVRNYADFTAEVAADTGKVNFIRSTATPDKVWVRTTILPDTGAGAVGFKHQGAGAASRVLEDRDRARVVYGDHASIDQSIAQAGPRRSVDLGGASVTLGSTPSNEFGVRLKNGKLLVPSRIPAFLTQCNSYAPDVNGLMIGREHLAAWWRSVSAGTFQTIHLYGDSTVEQNGLYVKSHVMFKLALYAAGVNNCLTANHGLGGTSWSDLNAIPNLGAGTKLIVIKYGINDATKSDALATMAADMRSKLSAIRAAANGGYTSLSILLLGPSSTYAPSHNQDAKWYEDVRNLYIQIANEFHCAYFDTYAYLQETSLAPGFWQDDLAAAPGYYAGEGLHPDPVAAYWIWFEAIKKHVLGEGQWNAVKANQHWNVAHASEQAYPTGEPSTFPPGLSQWGVLEADGWPAGGALTVHRQADGVTIQELVTLDVIPRRLVRTGIGSVWTQWTGLQVPVASSGGVDPYFKNSWVNVLGGYKPAGYMVTTNGTVKLFGSIKDGLNGVTAFTLPANARPAYAHSFDVAGGTIVIFADGNVMPTVSSTAHVRLGSIEFPVL